MARTEVIDQDVEARILEAFRPTFARAAGGMSRVATESVREVLSTSVPAGRVYRDSRGRRRRASAPGQPPADPTGTLQRSWDEAPARAGDAATRGASFSKNALSAVLEFGDPPVAPRPHARPGFALAGEKLKADLGQVLR